MFYIEIEKDLKLKLAMPKDAKEISKVVDDDRENISKWLPFANSATKESILDYINNRLEKFAKSETIYFLIIFQNKIVGAVDYNKINTDRKSATIGYWLHSKYNGKGIMTKAVKKLVELGFSEYNLEKVIIECDIKNSKSGAVAKRLGFELEGTLRKHIEVNGELVDTYYYGLLKDEFKN